MPEDILVPNDIEGLDEQPAANESAPSSPKDRFLKHAKYPPKCKDGSVPGKDVDPASPRAIRKARLLKRQADAKVAADAALVKLDSDGDGMVSKAEFVAGGGDAADFDKWDHDGNGQIDATELQFMETAKKAASEAAESLGRDTSGMISRAAFVAGGGDAADFDSWDKDRNGQLDSGELETMMAAKLKIDGAATATEEPTAREMHSSGKEKEGKEKEAGGCCVIC